MHSAYCWGRSRTGKQEIWVSSDAPSPAGGTYSCRSGPLDPLASDARDIVVGVGRTRVRAVGGPLDRSGRRAVDHRGIIGAVPKAVVRRWCTGSTVCGRRGRTEAARRNGLPIQPGLGLVEHRALNLALRRCSGRRVRRCGRRSRWRIGTNRGRPGAGEQMDFPHAIVVGAAVADRECPLPIHSAAPCGLCDDRLHRCARWLIDR